MQLILGDGCRGQRTRGGGGSSQRLREPGWKSDPAQSVGAFPRHLAPASGAADDIEGSREGALMGPGEYHIEIRRESSGIGGVPRQRPMSA